MTAKHIIERFDNKDDLLNYLKDDLFKISKYGNFEKHYAPELVGFVCALYAKKYKSEIFEDLNVLNMGNEKDEVVSEYIKSFAWREPLGIDVTYFLKCARKYQASIEDVWNTLIINSVNPKHPMNAGFLPNFLFELTVPLRA